MTQVLSFGNFAEKFWWNFCTWIYLSFFISGFILYAVCLKILLHIVLHLVEYRNYNFMLYFIYPSQLFKYVHTVWERAKNKENIYGWDLCTYYT